MAAATATLTDRLAVFDLANPSRPTRRWLRAGTVVAVELTPGATWARVTVAGEDKPYRAVPRFVIAATTPREN